MAARLAGDATIGHLNPRGHDSSCRIVQEHENTFTEAQGRRGGTKAQGALFELNIHGTLNVLFYYIRCDGLPACDWLLPVAQNLLAKQVWCNVVDCAYP